MSPTKLHLQGPVRKSGGALVAALILVGASGAVAQVPQLTIGNGSGVPDGQVAVTVSLSGAGGNAATAQLDVLFDEGVLAIGDPNSACLKDDRLTANSLKPTLPDAPPAPQGKKRLRLAILDLSFPIDSLSDGDLVTCTFDVLSGAPLGDVALTAERVLVGATNGAVVCGPGSEPPVDCEYVDGVISVVAPPTQTPTRTATVLPTGTFTAPPTATLTSVPTATVTVAPTATVTNVPPPTRTATRSGATGGGGDDSGSCSIAPAGRTSPAGALFLLIGPALLVWARRRRG